MKPAPFEYRAPDTLQEALTLLAENGFDAKLLAGGQSLIPVMNFRLAQPGVIIDLNRVSGLDQIDVLSDGQVSIGAMVRQATLEKSDLIRTRLPLLHQTIPFIAHPQIRNRGTIGGSLAHADPAAELPVISVALQAQFKLQNQSGERLVGAESFYKALFETELGEDEILTEVIFPATPTRTGYAFHELARRHGDYAQAGAAAVITLDEAGRCQNARLVFLNVGDIPMIASQAADMLTGNQLNDSLIEAAARHAADHEIEPGGDVHASAAYKRHLAFVLGKRAIYQARTAAQQLS